MRFRMYCAFGGISSISAFSTARTDVIACTVVQTPQKRCVNSHASRGSRPMRMRSIPRNICPDDHAAVDFDVDAEVAFDARHRIDGNVRAHQAACLSARGSAARIGNVRTITMYASTSNATSPMVITSSGTLGKYDQWGPGMKATR